jgi:hypothetical protein
VTHGYLVVGQSLQRGASIPYAPAVQKAAKDMQGVLNGKVKQLVFETAEDEAAVRAAPVPLTTKPREIITRGAVTGRVQTVTNRGSLRFTLYDLLHDRAVGCYLAEGREDLMLGAWGKVAVVEGLVRRDPETGRPLSVRQISELVVRPEGERDSYRAARGAVQGPFLMSPEEAIRRVRDG